MANTTHSKGYEKAKKYYPSHWTLPMVRALVPKNLTAEEYKEITGKDYPEV